MEEGVWKVTNDMGSCHKTDCEYFKCGRCVASVETVCVERSQSIMEGFGKDEEEEQ